MRHPIRAAVLALILLSLTACASPAPTPTPAPLPEAPVGLELDRTEKQSVTLQYHTPEGREILEVTIKGGDESRLAPFWPEIQAQLAPEAEKFGLGELARLALEHYRQDPAAFEERQWWLDFSEDWNYASGKLDDFPACIQRTDLSTVGESYSWLHSSFTGPDGEPAFFADLFTTDRDAAARRVLEEVLKANETLWPKSTQQDPEILRSAFDPERIIPAQDGLHVWYPYEALPAAEIDRGRSPWEVIVFYDELEDILVPISSEPVWRYQDEDIRYLLTPEGDIRPCGEDEEFFFCGDVPLIWSSHEVFQLGNAYQSPGWEAIQDRYDQEAEFLRADALRRAEEQAERYQAASEQAQEERDFCIRASAMLTPRCVRGQYLTVLQTISAGEDTSMMLESHQVYELESGALLTFRDLFDDPDRAERAAADYMRERGHTQERIDSGLEPYHFALNPTDITLYCPVGESAGMTVFWRKKELEPLGFDFMYHTDPAQGEECVIPLSVFADCGLRLAEE